LKSFSWWYRAFSGDVQVTNALPEYRDHQMPQLVDCDDADRFQQWSFTYGFDFTLVPEDAMR